MPRYATKVNKEAPSTSSAKIDFSSKQKKSAEKKLTGAKKSGKKLSLTGAFSPSANGETPKKLTKESKEPGETRHSIISQTFGFIGLGAMGSGMVKNLIKSGHKVKVWNRNSEKVQKFANIGAEVGSSPYEVMKATDITFSCLAGPSEAKLCLFGPNGVINGVNKTKCYVELTGIDVETSLDIADAICSQGGRYLEAQLQGSKNEAKEGNLLILCAGDKNVYNRCQSCFEAFGKASYFLGDAGTAVKMNLVIQLIRGVTLGGLSEGMALAERVGLQQADVLEVLASTPLNCPMIIDTAKQFFETSFCSSVPWNFLIKDLWSSLSLSDSAQLDLPLAAAAKEKFKQIERKL